MTCRVEYGALIGVVTTYHGLLACRFFLGACEGVYNPNFGSRYSSIELHHPHPVGGLLPGIVLYMSSFYERHHLQVRVAVLFTATSLAGAFSGLLAYGIEHMKDVGGKPGWA